MSDEQALLAGVLAEPADDTPRLVYADWLEEHGQVERAEFIRVQIEFAKAPTGPLLIREKELWGYHPQRDGVMKHFFSAHFGSAALLPSDEGKGLTHDYPWLIVRRGFIAEVRAPLAVLRGGECERCDGTGIGACPEVAEYIEIAGGCPICHGTGRTPGILAELARTQPVEVVRVTDVVPDFIDGDNRVWTTSRPELRGDGLIPADLFFRLEGGRLESGGVEWAERFGADDHWRIYPSEVAALAAFSNALLAEAKAVRP